MKRKKTLRASLAFTLVELLVVIAIIAMLVLILLPAISGTRESARRAQCISKMGKLMMATHDYEMNHGTFPAGTTHDQELALSLPQGKQLSWTAQLLPYLDENVAFRAIDQSKSVYDETNLKIRQRKMPPFICPSASTNGTVSNYAASHAGTAEPIGAKNNGMSA